MWEAVLIILGGGAAFGAGTLDRRKRLRAWQDAAVSCGLQVVETSSLWYPRLKAGAGLMEVRISSSGDGAQIVVNATWPPELQCVSIRPQTAIQPAEVEVGDKRFDDTFFVGGPSNLVLALLDAETRRLLFHMSLNGKLDISRGELRVVQMPDKNVPHALPLLLDVGRRFAQPMDIPRRLAENAHQDPISGVRLQNLLVLIRELPNDPATAEALRKACSDPSPEIRLRAARELGDAGQAVLVELAGSQADDAVSAQAVSILGQKLSFDLTRAFLDQALRKRRFRTARACLTALGRSEDAAAVDLLAKVLARERGELADAAAEALGRTGSPAAEAPLIQALGRERAEIRAAAAKALGHIGSATAVPPLKEAAERFSHDPELRRATRQAIAEIQSRLPGASPGQLSLSGAEAGQLSLAGAEAGQLSIATDPAGQLSMSGAEEELTPELPAGDL
jgi:HEAT repeats